MKQSIHKLHSQASKCLHSQLDRYQFDDHPKHLKIQTHSSILLKDFLAQLRFVERKIQQLIVKF